NQTETQIPTFDDLLILEDNDNENYYNKIPSIDKAERLIISKQEIVPQLQDSDCNIPPQNILKINKIKSEINKTNSQKQPPPLNLPIAHRTPSITDFIDDKKSAEINNTPEKAIATKEQDKPTEPAIINAYDQHNQSVKINSQTEPDHNSIFSIHKLKNYFLLKIAALKTCRLQTILPKQARHRAMASFLILSFVLVLPIQAMQNINNVEQTKTEITDSGKNAVQNLMAGLDNAQKGNLNAAGRQFGAASENFSKAQSSLSELNLATAALVNIIPSTEKTYQSVDNLISAGKNLADATYLLMQAGDQITQYQSASLVTKLDILQIYVGKALPLVEEASDNLKKVDTDIIPTDQQALLNKLQDTTPKLAQSMNEFLTFADTLQTILGKDGKKRYLLAFQNNTELRPTGGFIGSFAQVDLLDGEIENIEIPKGGSYDVQGQLSAYVAAPEPLQLINPRWEFHDANWFPDFPSSAQKMLWFYKKAGGPTVDGVIAINASVMPSLLELTGPIEMPKYNRTIDSENFLFETQKIVELEYMQYQDNNDNRTADAPKQFIGDLASKILEKLKNADTATLLKAIDLLGTSLAQKDVLLYFTDNQTQSKIETLGWSGEIKNPAGDYLMVVNSNLGGGKTDNVITQDIKLKVEIQNNGDIINTVTVTKTHHGLPGSLFKGVNNVDYIRFYVPQGSKLISASGFEIPPDYLFENSDLNLQKDEDLNLIMSGLNADLATGTDIWNESGKTVFGNWIQTAPGETQTVSISYKLPFSLEINKNQTNLIHQAKNKLGLKDLLTYSLFIQKQPGVNTRTTDVAISLPDSINIIWSSDNHIINNSVTIDNKYDQMFQLLLEP
ncbi:DUF4012 domain-containing protein, partial [Candidatus Parcubacteria bacterium]